MEDKKVLEPLAVLALASLLLTVGWSGLPGATSEEAPGVPVAAEGPGLETSPALTEQEASQAYTVPLRWIAGPGNGQPVPGSLVQVTATAGQVDVTAHATNLHPGHAYTTWLVTFPDPSLCVAPPNLPDPILRSGFPDVALQDAANESGALVAWGDGAVADDGGVASFTVQAVADQCWDDRDQVGHPPEGFPLGDEPCLVSDLSIPEFQLIVRDHGPYDPYAHGQAQLTTLDGGCEDYTCRDPQSTGVGNQVPFRCFPPQPSPDCLEGWVP